MSLAKLRELIDELQSGQIIDGYHLGTVEASEWFEKVDAAMNAVAPAWRRFSDEVPTEHRDVLCCGPDGLSLYTWHRSPVVWHSFLHDVYSWGAHRDLALTHWMYVEAPEAS